MPRAFASWLKIHAFSILFCILAALAVYYPVLIGYWAVNGSDGLNLHLPLNSLAARSFSAGAFPYWNSLFNLGQPVIDGTIAPFHPALILYAFFGPAQAHTFEVIAGLFMTLLGAWVFLSSLGLKRFAVSVGTICYVFCGPVFFLHSYHLGFTGIMLLPWCLYFFHRHDQTQCMRWLWLAAACLFIGAQATDADTALYLYAGLIIDRLVCVPLHRKKAYIFTWLSVVCLSALTGLAVYLPLYEWLSNSSRAFKSSAGILTPSAANLLSAIFTNHWLIDLPYDVFYFYLGPAFLWLIAASRPQVRARRYQERYLLFLCVIPLFYLVVRFLQHYSPGCIGSLDAWRSMFVFCLPLAIFAAEGAERLLKAGIFEFCLTLVCAALSITLAMVCLRKGFAPGSIAMLVTASSGMVMVIAGWSKTPLQVRRAGIVTALGATVFFAAFSRTNIIPSCAWNSAVLNLTVQPPYLQCRTFLQNLDYYRRLNRKGGEAGGSWRVSLLGGTDNTTALAGLKTLPNYTSVYNGHFEEVLRKDGLIKKENVHPYWMALGKADARLLSLYGVRFLVSLQDDIVPSPSDGWVARSDLSWPSHRVWENIHYVGRAYLISPLGRRRGGVEFLEDSHTRVRLRVTARQGEQLVLADLYYPGWEVIVGGKSIPAQRYHGCLRSVVLSAGVHDVIWRYTAKTQKKALLFSAIAFIFLAGELCFLSFVRHKGPKEEARV